MKNNSNKGSYVRPSIALIDVIIEDNISNSSMVTRSLVHPGDEEGLIYIEYEQGVNKDYEI